MNLPRLLLFGSTGAGKSSLLGALAQAAETQKTILKGQLVEKTGELDKLQKKTYAGTPISTAADESYDSRIQTAGLDKIQKNTKAGTLASTAGVESYHIHIDPADQGDSAVQATLLDCNGADALAMLNSANPFDDANPVQKPLLDADAILLLVDASLPPKQLDEQFHQFGEWLKDFHEARGSRTDVGEFPVYLVLTKCDLLANPDEPFTAWLNRIEERKKHVHEKFAAYLKDQMPGFGSIDLHVWATAIKRPALADRAAKTQEPFMVAELFRESMHAAADLQERRVASQHRLQNVLVGLVGVIVILVLSVAMLLVYQPDTTWTTLEDRAAQLLPRPDVPAAVRLGGTLKNLEKKHAELSEIATDHDFASFSPERQNQVLRYRGEIALYLELAEWAKTEVKFPFMAKTEEQYRENRKKLDGFKYPEHFEATPVSKRIQQARDEYENVEKEIKAELSWLKSQIDACNKLFATGAELQFRLSKGMKLTEKEELQWQREYIATTLARPRVARTSPIPGVSGVTYEFLDKFEAIQNTRKDWEAAKGRLNRLNQNIQDELM
jgi:GTPase SAR1 family protein